MLLFTVYVSGLWSLLCNHISVWFYIGLPHLSCSRASSSPFSRPMDEPSQSPSGVSPVIYKRTPRAPYWRPGNPCGKSWPSAGFLTAPVLSCSADTGCPKSHISAWCEWKLEVLLLEGTSVYSLLHKSAVAMLKNLHLPTLSRVSSLHYEDFWGKMLLICSLVWSHYCKWKLYQNGFTLLRNCGFLLLHKFMHFVLRQCSSWGMCSSPQQHWQHCCLPPGSTDSQGRSDVSSLNKTIVCGNCSACWFFSFWGMSNIQSWQMVSKIAIWV